MLRLKRDKYKLKIDYKLEYLPDDFIVYKHKENLGFYWRFLDGIKAKEATTSCCEGSRPLKYTPYLDKPEMWWLICSGCNSAISANGSI